MALPGAVVQSLAQQDPETGQAGFGCAKSLPRGRGLDEGPVPWGGGHCRSRRPSVLTSGSRPGGRGPRVLPRPRPAHPTLPSVARIQVSPACLSGLQWKLRDSPWGGCSGQRASWQTGATGRSGQDGKQRGRTSYSLVRKLTVSVQGGGREEPGPWASTGVGLTPEGPAPRLLITWCPQSPGMWSPLALYKSSLRRPLPGSNQPCPARDLST